MAPSTSRSHLQWSSLSRREKGIVLPLTALFLVFMIPMIGLAVDAGVLYVLKAKVQTSADAAAIAAARSLNVGLTLAAQETSAKNRALAFFEANFKAGSYGTKNQSVVPVVAETGFRTRTVTVTGSFDAPQYFMRFLGYNTTRVAAEGKASRRDVNLIMVLDRSGSMVDTTTNGQPCSTMRNSATNFTNMFAEQRDRLGLITFGGSYYVNFPPSMTFRTGSPSMLTRLAAITCSGGTATGTAVYEAYKLIQTINEPGALNLIVLFTDGYANTVTADFPVKTLSDRRYGFSGGSYSYSTTNKTYTGSVVCNSTSNLCDMEPSPCTDAQGDKYDRNSSQTQRTFNYTTSPPSTPQTWNPNWTPPATLRGSLTQAASDTYNVTTGATWGLIVPVASSATDVSDPNIAAAGCAFTSNFPGYNGNGASATNIRRDVAYMPDTDVYGNSTSGYKAVDTFNTSGHPYFGKKRIDIPMAVTGAGMNVLDSAASRMRADATLKPVIYTIGLGSNGGVDHELLRRTANDPTSPIYDDTKPPGLYVYAPTPTDLNYAFVRVASEILRIAQ